MDLVRDILFALEEHGGNFREHLPPERYPSESVAYHLTILRDSGLIEGPTPLKNEEYGIITLVLPERLTWAGHDFIDAARSLDNWRRAKSIAEKAGGYTIDVLKGILVRLISDAVAAAMGRPPGT